MSSYEGTTTPSRSRSATPCVTDTPVRARQCPRSGLKSPSCSEQSSCTSPVFLRSPTPDKMPQTSPSFSLFNSPSTTSHAALQTSPSLPRTPPLQHRKPRLSPLSVTQFLIPRLLQLIQPILFLKWLEPPCSSTSAGRHIDELVDIYVDSKTHPLSQYITVSSDVIVSKFTGLSLTE